MPDLPVLIFFCAAVFIAGVTTGMTSFGFALVTVPLLVIVLPPKIVVPVVSVLALLSGLAILLEVYKWIDLRRVWLLILAGIIGTPLGTYLLTILPASTLKAGIGVVTTFSALALLLGFQRPIGNERLASVPIGLVSGLLGGSTAMSGPPVILFFSNQGLDKQVFRGNLNIYFTIIKLWALPTQVAAGLITPTVLTWTLWAIPAMVLGVLLGVKLAHRVNEEAFRRLTLIVVIVTGLSAIASAIGAL